MNPDLLPTFVAIYQPDLVLCDGFAFQWPAYLRAGGWRLVFYSPNSSLWAPPGLRPDLPEVTNAEVERAFTDDLREHGLPRNRLLLGRNLVALHSLGDTAFAVRQLQSLPAAEHQAGWYWEAACIICFQYPFAPPDVRETLRQEANRAGEAGAEFCACDDERLGNLPEAEEELRQIPLGQLSDSQARLLLRIKVDRKEPDAVELASRESLFDLTDGEHWRSLAELEEQAGQPASAARAWRYTLYYAPELMPAKSEFTNSHPQVALGSFLMRYGWPPFDVPMARRADTPSEPAPVDRREIPPQIPRSSSR